MRARTREQARWAMWSRLLQLTLKRGVDRLLAASLLVIATPVLAAIALLIKLEDGGSVLFHSERAGLNARPFKLKKFRTMIPDADRYLDEDGRPLRNRVTRTGKYLRRWSLDEIPQLINVVRGEMSLIGPRPVPLDYADRMNPEQRLRFSMLPGMTGLAQVSGRHRLRWSQRIELDVQYVRRFSLLSDLGIVARTIPAVLSSDTLIERGNPKKVDL